MDRTYTAAVITVSDKGSRGERKDTAGPEVCRILKEDGYDVIHTVIVPDEKEEIKKVLPGEPFRGHSQEYKEGMA